MASTRNLTTTAGTGQVAGTAFDDSANIKNLSTATITRITLTYSSYITSLTVHYSDGSAPTRGVVSGTLADIVLGPSEFITSIIGIYYLTLITQISFVTNLGRTLGPHGPGGNFTGPFNWGGYGPNMGLLYFSGNASSHIHYLRATFGTYNPKVEAPIVRPPVGGPPSVVKYEKRRDDGPDTPRKDTLSRYAKVLMAPSITVVAGEDNIKFHVSEDILCLLERFHSLIHKQSGEMGSQERGVINLPGEEPEVVAAMIEFLATGSYTYTYPVPDGWTGAKPPTDLEEGQFHVDMYDIASRSAPKKPQGTSKRVLDAHKRFQDVFKRFQDVTVRCFLYVLSQLKGMDIIDLWKVAYDKGLTFAVWKKDDSDYIAFKKGAPSLLDVLKADKDKMDSIRREQRQLWDDLNDLRQAA